MGANNFGPPFLFAYGGVNMPDREIALVVTHAGRKPVWRWIRLQDGFRYILYRGSIWTVAKSDVGYGVWQLGRLVHMS